MLLGFAAVNTGNNLLYLLVSALLGFMAVSGVLGKWNLAHLAIDCVPPDEVFDGLPTLLGIELLNRRRWMPVFLMEVAFEDQAVLFPLVDPDSAVRKSLPVTLHGRGTHAPPALTLRSRFPINFFIRELGLPTTRPVTVFPRPQACAVPAQPDPGGTRGARQTWLKGQSGEVSRISDYRGGEPLKLIHWKLSARHDSLKVKELSATARAPLTLDIDTLPGGSLEERLRCGSWLVLRLLRADRPVGLRAGAMEISPDTGRTQRLLLLQALAHYGQNQDPA